MEEILTRIRFEDLREKGGNPTQTGRCEKGFTKRIDFCLGGRGDWVTWKSVTSKWESMSCTG